MAKSRQERSKAAVEAILAAEQRKRKARTRAEKVAAAIAKIRAFYELGRSLPPKTAPRDAYRQRIMVGEQERLGVNEDTLRKARAFADCGDGYTRDELDDLCRLIREIQPGQDSRRAIFEKTHVIRMLSVPRRRRKVFQRECITQGWSISELEAEISKRFGTRKQGGRRRSVPHDLAGFLVQAEGVCEAWRRWAEELSRDLTEVDEKHVFLVDLPEKLRRQIKKISRQVWQLHQDVAQELKKVQPGREIRGALRSNPKGQRQQARKG